MGTITNADYGNNLTFLASIPAQNEYLLYNLQQAAIDSTREISSCLLLKMVSSIGKPRKLVNQFIYLSNNISSTESYVNTRVDKAINWQVIDHMGIGSFW